jgi:hypothetical protein
VPFALKKTEVVVFQERKVVAFSGSAFTEVNMRLGRHLPGLLKASPKPMGKIGYCERYFSQGCGVEPDSSDI